MDCHDARLLLTLHRREPEHLDAAELEALERHVELCPSCQTWNRSEARFDAAISNAMRDVAIPSALKNAIDTKVRANRSPRRGVWAAAAAAGLLAIVGGASWYLTRPAQFDWSQVDFQEAMSREAAEEYFAALGHPVTAPPLFDYGYLSDYKLVAFQGRMTPRLTFGLYENRVYVYCVPANRFGDDAKSTDLPSHLAPNVTVWDTEGEGWVYVIDHTRNRGWEGLLHGRV